MVRTKRTNRKNHHTYKRNEKAMVQRLRYLKKRAEMADSNVVNATDDLFEIKEESLDEKCNNDSIENCNTVSIQQETEKIETNSKLDVKSNISAQHNKINNKNAAKEKSKFSPAATGSKTCRVDKQTKRKTVRITIAVKKVLIGMHENGIRVCELAKRFDMPKSTVCTIIKNKAAIKAANVAKGVTTLTARRSQQMEEMETLLLAWIHEKQQAGDMITEAIICKKAKAIQDDLVKDLKEKEEFKASRGWFDNFKKRSGIHNVFMPRDGVSSNLEDAEKFVMEFKDFVENEGYVSNPEFDCHKTERFRKKLPKRTYVVKEEKSGADHKLQQLHHQQQQRKDEISTVDIEDLLTMWSKTQKVIEKWHPDQALVNECVQSFNDNIIEHFRQIQNGRQYQSMLECSTTTCEPKPSTSGERLRYETPEMIPDIIMECASPSIQ